MSASTPTNTRGRVRAGRRRWWWTAKWRTLTPKP
jgi:hypothetical protein